MIGRVAIASALLALPVPEPLTPGGEPALYFTDLTSGPRTGNTDTSRGQPSGQDGALVTVWGKNLGSSQGSGSILVGGAPARVYTWSNAVAPADLSTRLGMQMVSFQIPAGAPDGDTTIQVVVDGTTSNALPFKIRPGKIFFVTAGAGDSGDGSWDWPWKSVSAAALQLSAGDTLYLCDGVQQTALDGDRATMDLEQSPGGQGADTPKALVGYPGATAQIGNTAYASSWSLWVPGFGGYTSYWTISKLTLTGGQTGAALSTGFRLVGCYITAPTGNEPTGAVTGVGNDLFMLGNEVTQTGYPGTSKLYHPIYIQSTEDNVGPTRLPTESNREVAWNYLHDNYSYDGINIYREGTFSAFMTNHRIHDNYILNQSGRGMLIGTYITGENWIYNNVIIRAGLGPVSSDGLELHVGVEINANIASGGPGTLIHFTNNTLYGCGWSAAPADWESGMIAFNNLSQYQLDFRNNLIASTSELYVNPGNSELPAAGASHNLWFGAGAAPAWDAGAVQGDPLLADPANGNVRPGAGSPAIGAGSAVAPIPPFDLDHVARPQGAGVDIGAYEFAQGTTNPAPNPSSANPPSPGSGQGGCGALGLEGALLAALLASRMRPRT